MPSCIRPSIPAQFLCDRWPVRAGIKGAWRRVIVSTEEECRVAAPRHTVNLRSWILVTAIGPNGNDQEQFHFFRAMALDASLSGLALIVSSRDVWELQQMTDRPIMKLLLPLVSEPVEMNVEPVRFQLLHDCDPQSILIGTRIVSMESDDRNRFHDFIRQCEIGQ